MSLILRNNKGSSLTYAELDGNFTYLEGLIGSSTPDLKTVNNVSLIGTGNISIIQPLKTINGQNINGSGNITISGGTQNLSSVLSTGNTTGPNDIIISDNRNILLGGYNSIFQNGQLVGPGSIQMGTMVNVNGGSNMFEMGNNNQISDSSFTFGSDNSNKGDHSVIFGVGNNIGSKTSLNFILSVDSTISDFSSNCAIIGGQGNLIAEKTLNSVALGGNNITVEQDNSVYIHFPVIISDSTPKTSSDPSGVVGEVRWDNGYIYIKTGSGWKRTSLSDF